MAGAYDRDIVIPTATAPTAPDTYEDPIQKKTRLGAIQEKYIDTRSKTRVELDGIVKTLGQIKSEIDKDPASAKYNLNGVVVSRKELLAYYNSASASTAEALKLQAIIDANDNVLIWGGYSQSINIGTVSLNSNGGGDCFAPLSSNERVLVIGDQLRAA